MVPSKYHTRWWFRNMFFSFSPRIPGEMIQVDEHVFQTGWKPPTSIKKGGFSMAMSVYRSVKELLWAVVSQQMSILDDQFP